jgi:hypothetical protein
VQTGQLSKLRALISEHQYQALRQWPVGLGGGDLGVEMLLHQVIRILQLPFNQNVGARLRIGLPQRTGEGGSVAANNECRCGHSVGGFEFSSEI